MIRWSDEGKSQEKQEETRCGVHGDLSGSIRAPPLKFVVRLPPLGLDLLRPPRDRLNPDAGKHFGYGQPWWCAERRRRDDGPDRDALDEGLVSTAQLGEPREPV